MIQARYPDYDHAAGPAQAARYATAAQSALQGMVPTATEEQQIQDAVIGLALQSQPWTPPMATFSLARVQLSVWFLFAVSTGVFLWIVYGELQPIDNSLLAILGLSLGVTGMSVIIDQSIPAHRFKPSEGFWRDITTGFDDKQQVHRYQAVVVNAMLLAAGAAHVMQQLSYPVFDPTWLAFLGVSGVALAVGKQITETQKPAARTV